MTIVQMNEVIQHHCDNTGDCWACELKDLCQTAKGQFIDNPAICVAAYQLLTAENLVNDPVNHPSHYTKGKIEVADFIADQKLNFDRGNAVKYVCRAGSKDPDKEIQDLEKAIWYINHEIKMLKGESENGTEKENA